MKIEFAKLSDVKGEITLTVEEMDYADKVKKELKDLGKKRPEPGFRAGHVPFAILEKKYGKAVKYEVINDVVGEAVYNYLKDSDLNVLGNPVPDEKNAINEDAAEFTLKFTVGIAPEINVKIDKDMHIPYYSINVTEEMIDRQDEALRRRFGKQEPGEEVDATALVKGVITEIDENGSPKEGGVVVENGIVAPQYFKSEDQKNIFLGHHVGDSLVFNPAETCDSNPTELSSMLNLPKEEAEEHKGDFKFDIKEIIVLKPAELGEEYYKDVFGDNVKDEKQYREAIKGMIEASLKSDQNYRFSVDAEEVIRKAVGDVELPDDILKDFLVSRNEGLTAENIEAEYPAIRNQVIWDLAKDKVMKELDVKVEKDDMLNTARMMARNQFAQYGMTNVPDDAVDRYANEILKDEKANSSILRQTADMKMFAKLHDTVQLDEKKVSVDDFNALFRQEEPKA